MDLNAKIVIIFLCFRIRSVTNRAGLHLAKQEKAKTTAHSECSHAMRVVLA